MFISALQFQQAMGVDIRIGQFFVDRNVPANNSFWKDRLLYIGFGNGYYSIPVYYDLLHRIGLPVEVLLEEKHILLMESIMHYAILQERKEISEAEELKSIRSLLEGRVQHPSYFEDLNKYLDQPVRKELGPFGLPYPSLNRADVFLYILCDLPLSEQQWQQAIGYWYALHSTYLIMDDIRDYRQDVTEGEDNVVIDLGGGPRGFEDALQILRHNGGILEAVNPLLAFFLLSDEEALLKYIPENN